MTTKFLIVGDLHGNKPKIYYKNFDAIIAPGDFCSDKGIRPLKNAWVKALKNKETDDSLDKFITKKIGKKKFKELNKKSLKVGRKILEFLNSFNKPVFIVPGNWDQSYGQTEIKDMDKDNYSYYKSALDHYLSDNINKFLIKKLKNIYDCQFKLHKFKDFNIIGYGLSSAPEKKFALNIKSNERRKKIKRAYFRLFDKLISVYSKANKNNLTIFLTHNVPYNTKLDIVLDKNSNLNKKHFGSTIALDFCKKYQPLICIGGHIHEHFKKDKIGKTTAINAGFGSFVNVWLEFDNNKIKKLEFYRGK